jgi:hypothetical protein
MQFISILLSSDRKGKVKAFESQAAEKDMEHP